MKLTTKSTSHGLLESRPHVIPIHVCLYVYWLASIKFYVVSWYG